jgi:hypothetical protein
MEVREEVLLETLGKIYLGDKPGMRCFKKLKALLLGKK